VGGAGLRTRDSPSTGYPGRACPRRHFARKIGDFPRDRARGDPAPILPFTLVMVRSVLVEQAVELLGVSRRTVYYRIRDGVLRTVRAPCGSQRVLLESIEAMLRIEHERRLERQRQQVARRRRRAERAKRAAVAVLRVTVEEATPATTRAAGA
jgi:excisionase family DNA binding protein